MTSPERLDLVAETREQPLERWLLWPAPFQIQKLEWIAQQDAARGHHPGGSNEVEHRNVQAALKAGERNDETAGIPATLDYEVGRLFRQWCNCKKSIRNDDLKNRGVLFAN